MASAVASLNSSYEALVAAMIKVERGPQQLLKDQRTVFSKTKTVLDSFTTALASLRKVAQEFADPTATPFAGKTATVTGTAATVTAADRVAPGAHTLTVERLARADARISKQLTTTGTALTSFFAANGPQTFGIEVAAPTAADPARRVTLNVTVSPTGTTDGAVLDEVQKAIATAVNDAVEAGTLTRAQAPSATVVHETSGTGRLSLRSAANGFDGRLAFTDSAAGLLGALEVTRSAVVGSSTSSTTAARGAAVTGNALGGSITISSAQRSVNVTVDGVARSVLLTAKTYASREELAAELQTRLGADVYVGLDGTKLQVTTKSTGAAASLQFTGGTALSRLGLTTMAAPVRGTDAQTTTATDTGGGQLVAVGTSEADSALTAAFVLDGVRMYRSTNTFTDALDGLSIRLAGVGDAPFTVAADTAGAQTRVEEFIKQYNGLLDFVRQKTAVDAETKTRGELAGDADVSGLRFGLRGDLVRAVTAAGPDADTLADLGITTAKDGTLTLADATKLTAALERDGTAVQTLFGGTDGVATRLVTRLDTFLGKGTQEGLVKGRQNGLAAQIKGLDRRIDAWEDRLTAREESLRLQFARLQEVVESMQNQQNYLNSVLYATV